MSVPAEPPVMGFLIIIEIVLIAFVIMLLFSSKKDSNDSKLLRNKVAVVIICFFMVCCTVLAFAYKPPTYYRYSSYALQITNSSKDFEIADFEIQDLPIQGEVEYNQEGNSAYIKGITWGFKLYYNETPLFYGENRASFHIEEESHVILAYITVRINNSDELMNITTIPSYRHWDGDADLPYIDYRFSHENDWVDLRLIIYPTPT